MLKALKNYADLRSLDSMQKLRGWREAAHQWTAAETGKFEELYAEIGNGVHSNRIIANAIGNGMHPNQVARFKRKYNIEKKREARKRAAAMQAVADVDERRTPTTESLRIAAFAVRRYQTRHGLRKEIEAIESNSTEILQPDADTQVYARPLTAPTNDNDIIVSDVTSQINDDQQILHHTQSNNTAMTGNEIR